MGNVLKLQEWGIDTAGMLPAKQAKILSLLDQIETSGRNWERFKWLLQVILPSKFEGVGEGHASVTVNNVIKFTVEEHAALKADYKQISERAERLLNNTNGETHK
jgi:hypothetical protein